MDSGSKKGLSPAVRKAVASVMMIVLAAMFFKFAFDAFSDVAGYAGPSGAGIYEYMLNGESCSGSSSASECCKSICVEWCGWKGMGLKKSEAVLSSDAGCSCSCRQ